MTSQWSLIFVIVLATANPLIVGSRDYIKAEPRGFGGPVAPIPEESAPPSSPLIYSFDSDDSSLLPGPIISPAEALAVGVAAPLSNVSISRNGLITYKVLAGDTLSGIAAKFSVSIDTLFWANSGLKNILTLGQELIILPVSGILYSIRDGDTIEGVLNAYSISRELFERYNPDFQKGFAANQTVILPYAKPLRELVQLSRYVQGAPDLQTYFTLPARGWNWGILHDFNAVDIADACGKPIYASAEGLVIEESGSNRWNDGYGNYVLIEHPNGTKTRYAHTLRNVVTWRDYVAQGDQIALIGNTGNTHGPTGCHLHFEVYGAKNPFAIR
jgi:murein DD-endopeptidase MepM/ murein hydrolase activator NlpD